MKRERDIEATSLNAEHHKESEYHRGMTDTLTCLKFLFGAVIMQSYSENVAVALEDGISKSGKALERKFKRNILVMKIKRIAMNGDLVKDLKKEKFAMSLISNGFNTRRAALDTGYSEAVASREGKRLIQDEGVQVLIGDYLARSQRESYADIQEMIEKASEIMRGRGTASDQLNAIKVLSDLYGVGGNNKSVSVNVGMGIIQQEAPKVKTTIIKLE